MTEFIAKKGTTFYRIDNDVNGNPRYIVHFFDLLSIKDNENYTLSVSEQLAIALSNAHKIGGSKYRGKQFGGGIVFQSYNIDDTENYIISARG